jgi:tripartite-type tricarboxylate transporter receptor subunit TctC
MRSFNVVNAVAVACLLLWTGSPSKAADYPAQPIRLLVPAAAGGAADTIARLVGRKLEALGKPVVVDNRPGAASIVGFTAGAKSPADGYTLILGFTGGLAINPSLYPDLAYNPGQDFEPIGLIAKSPLVVVANPSLGVKSLKELIVYAKANPGVLNFASTGSGSTQHLCTELIRSKAGLQMTHVPYKGSAPAYVDVIAGRTPIMCENVASMAGHIKQGSLVALAVTSAERVDALRDVPTLSEAGLEKVEASGWYGLLAPAKTPANIVSLLSAELRKIVADPEVNKLLADQGLIPTVDTPQAFRRFIETETIKWGTLVKESGTKAD